MPRNFRFLRSTEFLRHPWRRFALVLAQDASVSELWLRLFDILSNKKQFLLTFSLNLFSQVPTIFKTRNFSFYSTLRSNVKFSSSKNVTFRVFLLQFATDCHADCHKPPSRNCASVEFLAASLSFASTLMM